MQTWSYPRRWGRRQSSRPAEVLDSYQTRPTGKKLLHHALFDGAGLVEMLLKSSSFSVHGGEDCDDGALFG